MAGDPVILNVSAAPGNLKHTFTGIRPVFPNLAIHKIISEEFTPFRAALCRRPEFQSNGLWEQPLVTFCHSYLTKIAGAIRDLTQKDEVSVTAPLTDRQKTLDDSIKRMIGSESLEAIAADSNSTHGDLFLQPATPRIQAITFDWTGIDPDVPQPTPGRFQDPSARVLITGLDVLIVEMTNSPSSNASRTIIRNDAAIWIAWIADLYNVVAQASVNRNPYIPEGLNRSQYDSIWNAAGASDTKLNDGNAQQAEQAKTVGAAK